MLKITNCLDLWNKFVFFASFTNKTNKIISPNGVETEFKNINTASEYFWIGRIFKVHKSVEMITTKYAEAIRYKEEWTPKIWSEEMAKIKGLRLIRAEAYLLYFKISSVKIK